MPRLRIAVAPSVSGVRGTRAAILRTWTQYLQSTGGEYYQAACRPSAFWVAAEQRRWPCYHLAALYLSDGAVPEVRRIDRMTESSPDTYAVVTRFQEVVARSPTQSQWVDVTVFAVREGGAWKMSTALPRVTRAWARRTVGDWTYVLEPGVVFNRARADSAVAFVDSVIARFDVPRPPPHTYYVLSTLGAAFQAMGLAPDHAIGAAGALAQPTNRQLFSGIPALGENYRHELAHIALRPLVGNTSYFISEGVPTWLGGTVGLAFPAAARALAEYLATHPTATLDTFVLGTAPQAQLYPAGAVFAQMTYERGGMPAVRALFNAGGSPTFQPAMEQLFGEPWSEIQARWRRRVQAYGAAPP